MNKSIPNWTALILIACALSSGFMIGAVVGSNYERQKDLEANTPERIVMKTPASCVRALDLDDTVFITTGQAVSTGNWDPFNKLMDNVTDERIAMRDACIDGSH